jgi:hypothetical protein
VFSYQWLRGGAIISDATAPTYTLGDADVGAQISVRVSYTDGHNTVETLTSVATAAVANVNDAPTGAVTISGPATQGQTLTAANMLADADGLGPISYQWRADGADIAGATGTSYVLTEAEVGKAITVVASYTDGHGTQESVSSTATAAVADVNPVITVPAAQTAFEDVDKTISGIRVGDSDSDSLTVTLAVGHGTLTLGTASGLAVAGNGSGSVALSGSLANLNAALATLVYRGTLNYSGSDTLRLTASDGSLSTQARVALNVESAAQQAAALKAQVRALQAAGVLHKGQAHSLIVQLNLKGNHGDAGKVRRILNKVKASPPGVSRARRRPGRVQKFLNKVHALLKAGVLTPAQADALLGPGNILLLSVTRR